MDSNFALRVVLHCSKYSDPQYCNRLVLQVHSNTKYGNPTYSAANAVMHNRLIVIV